MSKKLQESQKYEDAKFALELQLQECRLSPCPVMPLKGIQQLDRVFSKLCQERVNGDAELALKLHRDLNVHSRGGSAVGGRGGRGSGYVTDSRGGGGTVGGRDGAIGGRGGGRGSGSAVGGRGDGSAVGGRGGGSAVGGRGGGGAIAGGGVIGSYGGSGTDGSGMVGIDPSNAMTDEQFENWLASGSGNVVSLTEEKRLKWLRSLPY